MTFSPAQLRDVWIQFFRDKGHKVVEPLSLIPPEEDKSTLFVNSGLCAIKKEFINQNKSSKICTSVQKVVRTVDIESIEKDSWHSTYFEMMGNFSIGGYFKKEAIEYAVEFLGSVLKLDLQKLVITIHEDDSESEEIWRSLLGSKLSILKLGKANFWEIGDGPCGPCTEIYYDRGEKYDPQQEGIRLIQDDKENDRYIEIWNIVFSQFWSKGGTYEELKSKNIDTGAGLERIVTILEDAENVYCSSQFSYVIKKLEEVTSHSYLDKKCSTQMNPLASDKVKANFQIISDHIRTSVILMGEGLAPSNKGRGYVIRKLLRRAFVSLYILGTSDMVETVKILAQLSVDSLSALYPNLQSLFPEIQKKIILEHSVYSKILINIEAKIDKLLNTNLDNLEEKVFTLIEREGAPLPLIESILKERKILFSAEKLKKLIESHRNKSKNEKFSSAFDLSDSN